MKKKPAPKKNPTGRTGRVQKLLNIEQSLHDRFIKIAHKNFQDFSKRVRYLISEDIKKDELNKLDNIN